MLKLTKRLREELKIDFGRRSSIQGGHEQEGVILTRSNKKISLHNIHRLRVSLVRLRLVPMWDATACAGVSSARSLVGAARWG
jgi:hypothetical protein